MTSYNFKVVLLGQGCVGKTSLVLRYVSNVFNDSHQSTIQASFLKKQLYLDQDLIRLNIWDTAGQEKFHALGPIYYREANGALLVYDVTNPDSLRKVRDWVKELNKMLGTQNVRLAIIGNKVDLLTTPTTAAAAATTTHHEHHHHHQQAITMNPLVLEAMKFADELTNARHYLTSAKLNQGIGDLFISLSRRMVEQFRRQTALRRDNQGRSLASHRGFGGSRAISLASNNELMGGDDDDDFGRLQQPRVSDRINRHQSTTRLDLSSATTNKNNSCSC